MNARKDQIALVGKLALQYYLSSSSPTFCVHLKLDLHDTFEKNGDLKNDND